MDRTTRRLGNVRVTVLGIVVSMAMLTSACSSDREKEVSSDLRSKISENGEGVAAVVRQSAAALGAKTLQAPVEPLTQPFVDGIVGAVDQLKDAAKGLGDGDANLLVYVGARYAVYKVAAGGGLGTLERDNERLSELLNAAKDDDVANFDDDELADKTRNLLRPLAYAGVLKNDAVVKQLIPPGSSEATMFGAWVEYDETGNPTVTLRSPGDDDNRADPTSWSAFVDKILEERRTAGVLSDVLLALESQIERST
jgi:hypothetical protein